jgi:hypothetical protein
MGLGKRRSIASSMKRKHWCDKHPRIRCGRVVDDRLAANEATDCGNLVGLHMNIEYVGRVALSIVTL